MYRTGIVCLLLFAVFTQQGCRNRQQADQSATDSTTATATNSTATTGAPISARLADLGLTETSDWRGISLGNPFSNVKAMEKGESFESDARHVGYTVEFKNLESSDILYYQTNQRVSAIEVDLFLNARASVDAYQNDLTSYFTNRYGTPKSAGNQTTWNGTDKTVTLTDVSKGRDFGLKIRIGGGSSTVAASAR